MNKTLVAVALVLASGCGAAQTALGALGSKPPQVTVVNNVSPAPVVAVNQQPAPTPVAKPTATKAVVAGGLAGAALGAATAAVTGASPTTIAAGAVVGAGAGSLVGYVVHAVE